VAKACEDGNLDTRALELYTRLEDIKRMVEKIHLDHSDWLIGFFELKPVGIWFDCLNAIVTENAQSLTVCVRIAVTYHESFPKELLPSLLEHLRKAHNYEVFFWVGCITITIKEFYFYF